MSKQLQKITLGLSARAEAQEKISAMRRFFIGAGHIARKPIEFARGLKGMIEVANQHQAETSSWVSPESLAAGTGGPFDACDLRHWLALANRAGVPAIPAREILHLTEEEIGILSGSIEVPSTPATRRLASAAAEVGRDLVADGDLGSSSSSIDEEALTDRLADAMDDIPEGWMVRSNRCGGSELKALAGVGITESRAPEVRFGPGLEVGPGWIRRGNRRHVNVSDLRTLKAAAEGPGFLTFLARPWTQTSRYLKAEDPHRVGTPLAGEGVWPAEWRVFIENGKVVGVSSYYGWADTPCPAAARAALEARRLAQRIVDEAMTQSAWPRYPDVEVVRGAPWIAKNPELQQRIEVDFGRETVSCTLDFLETEDGLVLLEGGPGSTPVGGGHVCAFAGTTGKPVIGTILKTEGVAFRAMPHILIADPSTWEEGDPSGCIFGWDEVQRLAEV